MEYAFKPTTHGRAVIAACGALEKPLCITRAAVGSGMVPEGIKLADVHELYQYVTEAAVSERRHENDLLFLTVQYANNEHKDAPAFVLSEFMIFAEDPETGEETDLLYAALGDYRQPVPAYNPDLPGSVFSYPLVTVVSDEIEVQVFAAPGIVTTDMLEEALAGIEAEVNDKTQIEAEAPPTPDTEGQPGQHYFDRKNKREYVCKGTTPEGEYIWEEAVTEDTVTQIVEKEIAKHVDENAHPGFSEKIKAAEEKADAAKTAASTAQATANTAKTTADAAKTAATTAQNTANGRLTYQAGSYAGNGTGASRTLSFSFTPRLVIITIPNGTTGVFINPATVGRFEHGVNAYNQTLSWSTNGLTITPQASNDNHVNAGGTNYWLAIG